LKLATDKFLLRDFVASDLGAYRALRSDAKVLRFSSELTRAEWLAISAAGTRP
jgi:hypothetical protein